MKDSNWKGIQPDADTPAGATYHFNRARPLAGCVVAGIGIAGDNLNEGDYVVSLLLVDPNTHRAFSISAWIDEERTRVGWFDIAEVKEGE